MTIPSPILLIVGTIVLLALVVRLYALRSSPGSKTKANRMLQSVRDGFCPDCGTYGTLMPGPTGGICVNVQCCNCGSEFNIGLVGNAPIFVERIAR